MNKLTKGSIAAGAGLVLLLGGAGTFMSWNADNEIDGGKVTAGHINITDANSTWTTSDGETINNITDYRMAPEDEIVYTTTMQVEVAGDNLSVIPTLTGDSITAVQSDDPADEALRDQLNHNTILAVNGTESTADNPYRLAAGTYPLTVTATLSFNNLPSDVSQRGEVTLDKMTVNLAQDTGEIPAAE